MSEQPKRNWDQETIKDIVGIELNPDALRDGTAPRLPFVLSPDGKLHELVENDVRPFDEARPREIERNALSGGSSKREEKNDE